MAFWRSYAHLVWATKNRKPFITPQVERHLYPYLISKATELDCYLHAINGVEDHIHLVISIPPKHSVSWVVKTFKGSSSHFINNVLRLPEFRFSWQRGYGYLSLGEKQCDNAVSYVEQQKERHRRGDVNPWLERHSELDEDCVHSTLDSSHDGDIQLLRETEIAYPAESIMPF